METIKQRKALVTLAYTLSDGSLMRHLFNQAPSSMLIYLVTMAIEQHKVTLQSLPIRLHKLYDRFPPAIQTMLATNELFYLPKEIKAPVRIRNRNVRLAPYKKRRFKKHIVDILFFWFYTENIREPNDKQTELIVEQTQLTDEKNSLTYTQVRTWFQNRRTRENRLKAKKEAIVIEDDNEEFIG